ncbi:MAG: hypothetical protein CMJ18_01280 [Phycisphaeraceae bacterium]|nr:hypothetical protein [Phycisphaeraceae bacterium]
MFRDYPRLAALFRMHAGWYALGAAVALTLIGVEAIRTVEPYWASRQTVWFVVSLMVSSLCLLPRPRSVGLASFALLGASVLLLLILVIPGIPETIAPKINNARSWIDLQVIKFQPSELAKVAFVLAIAWYLRYRRSYRTMRGLSVPFLIMLAPVGLILKQPDLGTAMIFIPALLVVLVAAGARLKHISALLLVGVLAAGAVVAAIYVAPNLADQVLSDRQQDRFRSLISVFRGDDRYAHSIGFQQDKSRELIGAGGIRGYGAARSARLIRLHGLPFAYHDMIFAVIVNRWGLIGGLLVMGLYLVIVLCFAAIAGRSRDPFIRLAVIGFGGVLFSQAALNIGVSIGLLPVTGVTLPFVSYGGSSLVVTFMMIALSINFASYAPATPARPSFEFAQAGS